MINDIDRIRKVTNIQPRRWTGLSIYYHGISNYPETNTPINELMRNLIRQRTEGKVPARTPIKDGIKILKACRRISPPDMPADILKGCSSSSPSSPSPSLPPTIKKEKKDKAEIQPADTTLYNIIKTRFEKSNLRNDLPTTGERGRRLTV